MLVSGTDLAIWQVLTVALPGKFMEYGFKQTSLNLSSDIGGINFTLLEPLVYQMKSGKTIRATTGTVTDGVSIPRFARNIIERVGSLFYAGIIHDSAYKDTLEVLDADGGWSKFTMNEDQADDLIQEAAQSLGASELESVTIHDALHLFGWRAFNDDRKRTT